MRLPSSGSDPVAAQERVVPVTTLVLGEILGVVTEGLVLAMVTSEDVVVVVQPSELVTKQLRVPLTGAVAGVKVILFPFPMTLPFMVQL